MPEQIDPQLVTRCVRTLVEELMLGPMGRGSWILDARSPGFLARLRDVDAVTASRRATVGSHSVAGHVAHMCYGLQLLNRWARGEDAFADADWSASWQPEKVDAPQWSMLVDELERQARAWDDALMVPREWEEVTLTGAISSVSHLAYHAGAVAEALRVLAQTSGTAASPNGEGREPERERDRRAETTVETTLPKRGERTQSNVGE